MQADSFLFGSLDPGSMIKVKPTGEEVRGGGVGTACWKLLFRWCYNRGTQEVGNGTFEILTIEPVYASLIRLNLADTPFATECLRGLFYL